MCHCSTGIDRAPWSTHVRMLREERTSGAMETSAQITEENRRKRGGSTEGTGSVPLHMGMARGLRP